MRVRPLRGRRECQHHTIRRSLTRGYQSHDLFKVFSNGINQQQKFDTYKIIDLFKAFSTISTCVGATT